MQLCIASRSAAVSPRRPQAAQPAGLIQIALATRLNALRAVQMAYVGEKATTSGPRQSGMRSHAQAASGRLGHNRRLVAEPRLVREQVRWVHPQAVVLLGTVE